MKFPGGNQLLFCEQVGTVTSFFEQWNDCERTVVLYALLKRVPFANLKFLQLSIDYNLAQNYSSQSKLQLLETHANNANFLNKLVQRYQTTTSTGTTTTSSACCVGGGGAGDMNATLHNHNNNNTSIANNNLTISDSGCESEKKNSTFDLSSTSSSSCSSTSGVSSVSSLSSHTTSLLPPSSSSSAASSNGLLTAGKTQEHHHHQSSKVSPISNSKTKTVETKKDILNDMLTYLPLLKPGNDDVKSVYMSLIPAAVEDACQQTVPTELVQHILSYLLIHPAVNNDDRRSLSYWLRHLEEHIATSYIPTTLASSAATATAANSNKNPTKMVNSNSTYFIHPSASQQQQIVGGSNQNLACKTSSSQFLATGPWPQMPTQQQPQQHHHHNSHNPHHQNSNSINTGSCNQLPQQQQARPSVCISSSSSLLSKSQQSLSQAGSSSSSSSSCLDSTSSQLLKTTKLLANLDWCTDVVGKQQEDGGGGGGSSGSGSSTTVIGDGNGNSGSAVRGIGSVENVSIKEFVPVTFSYTPPQGSNKSIGNSSSASSAGTATNNSSKHHHLIASSSQASGGLLGSSANGGSLNMNGGGGLGGHTVVLSDLDSSDDNHLSFSKNGTEIFDYDCDYDNEEEFNYLARAAAAVAASTSATSSCTPGGTNAAGSAAVPSSGLNVPANTSSGSSNSNSSSKNRVSFDANISDFLRVPPIGDFDMDGSGLLKTRRSNSLTTTASSACGLSVGELHQQKHNNEYLSAENLTNLQLLQNKPRSFSLTMDSPRSSLTSSGSETRLDDFKQHQMIKMYGSPNIGMSSIAHWLKSLRLHKYVWLFSNLTYEQMMEMTEEYLANLGVTKGARHKLVLCIHKLKERYSVLLRLEKDILTAGGSRTQLGPVFDELTNIVLTPMKPVGHDQKEDIAGLFVKLLDLLASLTLSRPLCGPQEEECMNVYIWVLERALHNDAFATHATQIKEYKYKANKLKIAYAPKGHYSKNNSINGNINKPRWHKPNNPADGQKTPHRKSSLQYFTPPMQQSQTSQQQSQQPQQQSQQQQNSSSSHTHLQALPHQYYGHGGHNPNAGTGHNNNYNKSSSYPNFASNLSSGGGSGSNNTIKHHMQHLQQTQGQHSIPQQQQPQPQQPHHAAQQQQQSHVPPLGNFMYHRHSLNNIHQHQQQYLQQLQSQHQHQQQQHQSLLPSIFLTAIGGGGCPPPNKGKPQTSESACTKPKDRTISPKSSPVDLLGSKSQNNSIGDINTRLEFLCLQMTEQAID